MEHTQNNSLPIDVQIDILRRLPAKPLVQYKCVSKYWRTLITSERFSKVYQQMNKQNNQSQNSNTSNPIILVGTSTILIFNFSSAQSTVCKLPVPPTLLLKHRSVIGSAAGLLCLQHPPLSTQTIALYSPITRAYRVLPLLKTNRDYMIYHHIGLGYDHTSNDFKIVSLQDRPYLFRLRSNCWEVIQFAESKFDNYSLSLGLRETMIVSNNAIHWLPLIRNCSTSILAFDLGTEVFYNVPMPDCSDHYRKHIISWDLTDVKGYLHLSITTKFDTCRFPGMDIWIMKEYGVKQSWTKLLCYTSKEFCYLFVIPSTSPNLYFKTITTSMFRPRVYAYSKDDQEVLLGLELNPKNFYSCHLRTRKVKKVEALCNLLDEEDQGFSVVPWTCTFASCE